MKCDNCKNEIGSAYAIQTYPDHLTITNERLLCDKCHKEFSKMMENWLEGK